jgi:hypothetical protein
MFLSSRMFTPGFKLFFGIALFLFGGTVLFGMSSSLLVEGTDIGDRLAQQGVIETVTGPITAGWKGPVGNHAGYGLLLTATGLAAFLGLILIAFRDADPEAEAQLLEVETVPLTRAPSGTNFAPVIAAFSLALMAIGWVAGSFLLYAGITLLVVTAATWTVRAWAERATGDAEVNHQIYTRIIDPLRVPVVGVLLIGFLVIGLSRVLLAVPDVNWSRIIFGVAAVVLFAGVIVVAAAPRLAKPLATILIVLAAVAVLIGGIWGIAAGERHIEPHGHETGVEGVHTSVPGGGGGEAPTGEGHG